jgi:hypothetical protein
MTFILSKFFGKLTLKQLIFLKLVDISLVPQYNYPPNYIVPNKNYIRT